MESVKNPLSTENFLTTYNAMKRRDFCVLIISYGRPDCVKSWTTLDRFYSKAPRYIICSDDDKTLPRYKELYGEDHILVFNKEEEKKNFDVGDNYAGMYNSSCFAHNTYFRFARQLGYKYFLAMDDDSEIYRIRYQNPSEVTVLEDGTPKGPVRAAKIPDGRFDDVCEAYFRMLDSAPWLYCMAFSQGGDYIGGYNSATWKQKLRWKAMNSFFCCTDKEWQMPGRINEDATAYVYNSHKGRVSITLAEVMLDQPSTQQMKGGMTDIYRDNGTWLKTAYTVMMCPSAVKFAIMPTSHRIHHNVNFSYCVPKVLSSKYCKGTPLKWEEVISD